MSTTIPSSLNEQTLRNLIRAIEHAQETRSGEGSYSLSAHELAQVMGSIAFLLLRGDGDREHKLTTIKEMDELVAQHTSTLRMLLDTLYEYGVARGRGIIPEASTPRADLVA